MKPGQVIVALYMAWAIGAAWWNWGEVGATAFQLCLDAAPGRFQACMVNFKGWAFFGAAAWIGIQVFILSAVLTVIGWVVRLFRRA